MKIVRRDLVPDGPGSVKVIFFIELSNFRSILIPQIKKTIKLIWLLYILKKNHIFSLQIIPEEADDLWVAYNLIAEGDTVLAITVRYYNFAQFRYNFAQFQYMSLLPQSQFIWRYLTVRGVLRK